MWLKRNDLEEYLEGFYKLGYFDIEVIKEEMDEYKMKKIIATVNGSPADNKQLIQAVEKLRGNSDGWLILRIIYFFFQCIFFLFKWVCKYYCKNICHTFYSNPCLSYCAFTVAYSGLKKGSQPFCILCVFAVKLLLFALTFYFVRNYTLRQYRFIHTRQPRGCSFAQYLLGNFLNPSSCKVHWLWEDRIQVGRVLHSF